MDSSRPHLTNLFLLKPMPSIYRALSPLPSLLNVVPASLPPHPSLRPNVSSESSRGLTGPPLPQSQWPLSYAIGWATDLPSRRLKTLSSHLWSWLRLFFPLFYTLLPMSNLFWLRLSPVLDGIPESTILSLWNSSSLWSSTIIKALIPTPE